MHVVLIASALVVGALLAVQASANLQLTRAVGTPFGAATLQLAIAAGLLTILAISTGAIPAVRSVPDAEWWHLLGGLASPLYITSAILLFPRLGALAATGLFVTGQVASSLALDLFGLFGLSRRPVSVAGVAGAVAVLAGIVLILRAMRAADSAGRSTGEAVQVGTRASWVSLGLVAGAALPVQGAINARLRSDVGEPVVVAMVSFVVATLAIALVLGVLVATNGLRSHRCQGCVCMPWWGWVGGACAATYVTATFLLIPEIGAATTVALTVTGQQVASAVVDARGLFWLPRRPLTTRRVGGLALLTVGSAVVQIA